jgi:hypothetical protein
MEQLNSEIAICMFASEMKKAGSWCGETHLQKALYLGQEIFGLNTGFNFILYKHGPFSFEVRDQLNFARAVRLLRLVPNEPPYGPSYATTEIGETVQKQAANKFTNESNLVKLIASTLGKKGVSDLERLATAVYVLAKSSSPPHVDKLAGELHQIKPHVTAESALQAVQEAMALQRSSKEQECSVA